MVREGRIFTSVNTDPDFGASYKVTAYEVGAQVTGTYTGGAVPVQVGHGFATNDKFIVAGEFPATTKMRTVTGTTTTTISCASVTVAAGDILINLAADGETVAGTPNYDGNGLAVYTDMAYGSQATNNTVTCDSNGRYRYFHKGIAIWELVRTSAGVLFSYFLDAGISAVTGPDSTTDNAVVRWDGTTGETTQNSVVLVGDTGAVTGVTTLAMGGALSGVTTLAVSGTSTLAAVNASGLVAAAGAVTVGTTLGVTGASTLAAATASGLITASAGVTVATGQAVTLSGSATLSTSTGAATLGGGIAGGIPRNCGTWSIVATTNGNDNACTNGTVYVGSVFVPANMSIVGIQYLIGSVGGTTLAIASLYKADGTLVANSATAGTTVGTTATIQQLAFTAPYAAVGPAWFFVGLTFNGTTAKFRTVPANMNINGVIGNSLSQTFGTPASITPPTTFTLNTVPVASLY